MSKEIPSHLALTIDGQGSKDASGNREYDKTANEILSDPQIVSRIVCAFVPGFTRLTPEEVERECLIGPDHAGEQPVTRADRAIMRVNQQNGVDKTVSEGTAVFDVLTRLKLPGGNESMIIDLHLEEQTTEYLSYPIEKRALYYIARLLSIQGEDLVAEELYKLLHRVVSVWIILDPHAADRATVTHTHLVTDDIVGAAGHLPENTDLVDIFYLRLNKVNPGVSEGVLGMLEVLFSNTISADDKKQILENKYNMSMTTKIQKGVTNMSGLGEAIYQNGKADGMSQGMAQGMAEGMAQGMAQGMVEGKAGLVIDCMNATGCGVEEAVEKVVYDRNQRPAVTEAVNARLARERAGAERATA